MRLLTLLLLTVGFVSAQEVERFGDLSVCSLCHLRIPSPGDSDSGGEFVSPSSLWPGTMMAHAARDPYWRAKVRYEMAETPELSEVIEDTCLRCHAPMQQYDLRLSGKRMALSDIDNVGAQGVGCTVCHQITDEKLGTKASFEAGFVINDDGLAYGPHARPFSHPMEMHSAYTPAHGQHILEASLCGTCHTVITPTVDSTGKVRGEFVEQAPYLEWLASDFGEMGMSCQDCHLPVLEDKTGKPAAQYIAHNPMGFWFPPTRPRKPFGQHQMVGGNLPMLGMLKEIYPDESESLDAKRDQTQAMLDTALSLTASGKITATGLEVTVNVANNTGHKLPTGFPSRRIWLHVTVLDAKGDSVFESGAWDRSTGEIVGLEGFEPHRNRITQPDQAMVYETELADNDGRYTHTLLRAAAYLKDNRLLPSGFDLERTLPDGIDPGSIAPAGVVGNPHFTAGGHRIRYEITAASGSGPYRISIEALYQSIKPSHATVLHGTSNDAKTFLELYDRHRAPVRIAGTKIRVPNR